MPKPSDQLRAGLKTQFPGSPAAASETEAILDSLRVRPSRTLVNGDFANSGWGGGAVLAVDSGSEESQGGVTMTAGTSPSANPTVTLTFPVGAYSAAPFIVASLDPGTAADSSLPIAVTVTTTTVKFTLGGTPTNTRTYHIMWHLFERPAA